MENKRTILILGASQLQVPAIIKAKEMNLKVIVVDVNPCAPGVKIADIFLEISTLNIEQVLQVARKYKIDAVMTLATDLPIRTIAKICEELDLVGIKEEIAKKVTDKGMMRETLSNSGVPVPQFFKVLNSDEYKNAIIEIKGKKIIKPVDSSGSRGVFLLTNTNNKKAVDYAYDYSKSYSKSNEVLVEEYMEGPEVSVESITYKGKTTIIAVTDKMTTGAPRFVEMGHTQPSKLSENVLKEIRDITINAIHALKIDNAPSHTEIIVTNDGPKIVEVGARLGGDNITSHLVPLSTGVDMIGSSINLALGNKPDLAPKKIMGSSIIYLHSVPGEIESIRGLDRARKIDGVKEIHLYKRENDIVTEIKNSTDRVGYIISQSTSAEKAYEICKQAFAEIKINIFN